MQQPAKELRYFLFSQQLADGVRTTAAILLPALVLYQFGEVGIGIAISLGALSVSITDAPGPIVDRRNGMLATALLSFVIAVITAAIHTSVFLIGIEITLFTFLFSLLQVYGVRAAGVGNAAILIMILTMGRTDTVRPLLYGAFIAGGGIWYTGISLFFYYIRPYRPAQRVLGDCIREVAGYLAVKGLFYDVQTDLQEDYKKLVAQQVVVNEKQDAVRAFFFKTVRIVNETTVRGRRLVTTFVHTVDLFEDITAIYYNYSTLRKRFERSGLLQHIATFITNMAAELDAIGIAVQSNSRRAPAFNADEAIRDLKRRVDALGQSEPEENTVILKKILVNMRRIAQRINEINMYFDAAKKFSKSHVDHTRFIGAQAPDLKLLWSNFNFKSAAFRHAMRIAAACLAGFALSKVLAYGQRSYWILLTIALILKPAFSLTKTRNIERIWGTVAGGIIGVLILLFIKNTTVQFIVMVVLMMGTYTFARTKYVVMVICMTAYILIMFQFLHIPFISVVQERIFDTVLGGAIAFSAGYFLFPDWEAEQLHTHMADVLLANAAYLQKVTEALEGKAVDHVEYKLARKAVYVQSANLSAAYQRMAAEPKKRQRNLQHTHQFLVRNHLLFSNIAHVAALINEKPYHFSQTPAALANKAVEKLYGLLKKLDVQDSGTRIQPAAFSAPAMPVAASPETNLIQANLEFINRLCSDIEKTTEAILAA